MSITEDRIDEILRTSMFSNKSHQEQLKQMLRSSPGELTEEELLELDKAIEEAMG